MTKTALTLIDASKLPMRPLQTASLPQHERDRHRAEIGATIEAMLASWFVPTMSAAAQVAYLQDWIDTLEGFTPGLIRKAFSAHRDARPDARPNPSHIKAILADRWGRHVVSQAKTEGLIEAQQDAPRDPVSKERAAEILAAAGFRPLRIPEAKA